MARVTGTIPNLINGVSQQPDNLRLASQFALVDNCYTSVVNGLSKRMPTINDGRINVTPFGNIFTHWINRDATERYAVVIANESLRVFDLDGNEKTVNFPSGAGYLACSDAKNDFAAVTVADYTFIVNKTKTVAMSASASAALEQRAVLWVRGGAYSTNYSVKIDGQTFLSHTPGAENWNSEGTIKTNRIAGYLYNGTSTGYSGSSYSGVAGGISAIAGSYNTSLNDNYIVVEKTSGNFSEVKFTDAAGEANAKTVYKEVKTTNDLPPRCVNGQRIKVRAKEGASIGDYWVKFETRDGIAFGDGSWKECVAPGMQCQFNASTMPYQLIREADGTFTFSPATWLDREVGDDDSNPIPSFVGQNITDVVFHRNRLGFMAGENVILSEAGEYFSFFRKTVTTVLDTDPIDVSVAHVKASTISAAIPIKKNLVLFSDQTQFVLSASNILTAESATITPVTEYENSPVAHPVGNGKFIYFVVETTGHASIREFFVADDTDTQPTDSVDVTAHVPSFIGAGVTRIEPSTAVDVICVLTDGAPDKVFVYKFFWQGNDRLQNAWSTWSLGDNAYVRSVKFYQSALHMIVEREDGVYMEHIDLAENATDAGFPFTVRLDRRITDADCTVFYDAATNTTTWTLPYAESGDMSVVVRDGGSVPKGRRISTAHPTATTLTAFGNFSSVPVFIGKDYEARLRFSSFVVREQSRGGGDVVVTDGRVQVKTLRVNYVNTGYFRIEVTPNYRDTSSTEFTGRILGQGANVVGGLPLDDGSMQVVVLSKNDQVKIDLVNDTFLPSTFISAEWTADFTVKSQRV